MKILVTGATSQIGRELHNVLEAKMPGVTTYVSKEDFDLTDVTATRHYLEKGQFTHIVNCAVYNKIDKAEEESGLCAEVNTGAISTLANYADVYGYRIVHISTDFVFDGMSYRPYNESDKVNPTTRYGATRRKGETALIALAPESVIIRTGWIFSPYGDNFVTRILHRIKREKTISVVADQVGSPTYALDLAKAVYAVLTAQQWVPGVFNFVDEGVASRYDFAKAIQRLIDNTTCHITPIPAKDYPTIAPRPYYSVLDTTRIKATYDIDIPHWVESLSDCLKRIEKE